MKRINLELSDELYAQVRAAAGDVPVNRWLRRAVEQALEDERADRRHRDQYAAHERFRQASSSPAERPLGLAIQQAARSSSQAKRGVEPRPKKAR